MRYYAWQRFNETNPERLAAKRDKAARAKARAHATEVKLAKARAKLDPLLAKETRHIIEGLESSPLIFGEENQLALESKYQADLIQRLYEMFPGCFIQKLDSSYTQGIPDLLILFNDRWAVLEVKAAWNSPEQPNQRWYVEKMNAMSFAAFIYPENEEEVLRGVQQALKPPRKSRVPQRQQVPLDQLR